MQLKRWGVLLLVVTMIAAFAVGCGAPKETTPTSPNNQGQPPGNDTAGNAGLKVGVYSGVGQGYGGEIKLEVTVAGGEISAIKLVSSKETDSIGGKAMDTLITAAIDSQSTDFDAVTGATKTTAGFKTALEMALQEAAK